MLLLSFRRCLSFSCCFHLLLSRRNEREQKKNHQHVRFFGKNSPSVSANVHAKPTRGWREWCPLVARLWVGEDSRRDSAGSLLSLHAQNNILMKERPDRAKCPRRVALPNCGFPRPSAAGYFRPSPGKRTKCARQLSNHSHHRPSPLYDAATLLPTLIRNENCAAGGHKKGKVVWPTTTIRRGFLGCFWVLVCPGRDDSCALGSRCATTKQLPPIPPPLPPPLHHHHHYYHHQITIAIEYISRSSGKLWRRYRLNANRAPKPRNEDVAGGIR